MTTTSPPFLLCFGLLFAFLRQSLLNTSYRTEISFMFGTGEDIVKENSKIRHSRKTFDVGGQSMIQMGRHFKNIF